MNGYFKNEHDENKVGRNLSEKILNEKKQDSDLQQKIQYHGELYM